MRAQAAVALLASVAFLQAAAQGGDADVAEELRQLREQLKEQAEEAGRKSEALFWSSFLVGICVALVAVAGTACSALYLRRHVSLLVTDAQERLRPALARTNCYVSEEAESGAGQRTRHLVFEITNVGAVAAVGIEGRVRHGTGTGVDGTDDLQSTNWSIGALAPGQKKIFKTEIRTRRGKGTDASFWLDVTLDYKAIGGRLFRYHAACEVHGDDAQVLETAP